MTDPDYGYPALEDLADVQAADVATPADAGADAELLRRQAAADRIGDELFPELFA
jgi:hypothetical protein